MSRRPFSAVRTEGGLLPQDLLARVQAGDASLDGTKAETFHLAPHERVGEAVNRSWSRLVATWHAFQEALAKEPEGSLATGLTRDRWLLPLFQELGYGRLPRGTAISVEGRSYAVSHTWHHSPVHLLGVGVDLDRRQKGVAGAAKSSPHGLVQEFLNRSDDHLWGFVSNGLQLRVLRDHHSLTRQAYVEFDLQAIMDGEHYSEFLLLWLVCHQSRVEAGKPEDCWLETWSKTSKEEGVRALDKLRGGVEKAIEAFGAGFLAHKENSRLHEALRSGELDAQEYYRQVLRLVYRLIFLFVAEERDVLLDPNASEAAQERYRRYYATRRLRDLADKRRGGPHGDLWQGLVLVMEKLEAGYPPLALPALGSMLWGTSACPWLMDAECANHRVLAAIRQISHIQEGRTRYAVNWRNIGADELGSIYEGLLELHPRLHVEAGTFELSTAAGHERKTTGSYYTPTPLVDSLLDSALDPVLDAAVKRGEQAVLNLKVCDPACGSGHFLVAAARRIAKRLASVRSGDVEPSPADVQRALRDVVGRCIFGVDINPMAVELCKVSLWMEAIEPGRPLSFLDSHIQCGNALLGATPALMAGGIPDDALKAIPGDDKEVAKRLRKRNRKERKTKQEGLPFPRPEDREVFEEFVACDMGPDFDLASVKEQETCWVSLHRTRAYRDALFLADGWCAAFVWPKQVGEAEEMALTHGLWRRLEHDVTEAPRSTRKTVRDLARHYGFFHWHLAFPAVFGEVKAEFEVGETTGWTGGFDVVLGNPPWERIKLQEKEFFSSPAPQIASINNAQRRQEAIDALKEDNPRLWADWAAALRTAGGIANLVRDSGRYPLCGRGDVNTYSIFAELNHGLLTDTGRAGFIVPSGIATDATTQYYFRSLIEQGQLALMLSFWEIRRIFPGTDSRQSFALFTIRAVPGPTAEFAFNLRHTDELRDLERRFELSAVDIGLLNPNTGTCPVFASRRDAEITKGIYRRVPVLWDERTPDGNAWGLTIRRAFDMNKPDVLALCTEQPASGSTPIYEAKLVHQYDHRFGDYADKPADSASTALPKIEPGRLADPGFRVTPRYWLPVSEVTGRLQDRWNQNWLLVWRDIGRITDFRTAISAIIPLVGTDFTLRLGTLSEPTLAPALLASFNSLVFDYVTRQKLGGTHLSDYILRQLPVFKPDSFDRPVRWDRNTTVMAWIRDRVLELTYTAWDLGQFALDQGYDGPPFRWNEERRAEIRAELDAAFFHLYGIPRDDVEYILETFTVLRSREEKQHGFYRTMSLVLREYDAMQSAVDGGTSHRSALVPPPADASLANTTEIRPDWAGVA